ncbi:glutamate/tyrosine decarboxylase-like PLP-dependent enzyme [Arthrobacter stackebrandtii]|uniref:Glutamate/tyrosine decarboxylase-like PLP-dependent enzyme n=1 Tax=Arthrobacter stackebrandtii TaxID=272161 RepID=A0ABS4YRM9_9MICC|nr:aminotransferase class V-fold PLP-dependent enzyme [Arthrobacter stackebrandtii]MBP2411453.1 glutamate/tyrosine decarboxylase-like PLP-dependent enzyme [Arthrobacter stackebrandtii]PYH00343.1 aspartate aminotransferase family protein [Arthrobacter stackebrandtii]
MGSKDQAAEYRAALDAAHAHASDWLASLPTRPVGPRLGADELLARFSMPLQEQSLDPAAVVDELARLAEPGLMAMPSGRFFGWVIGGTLPAAMAADWLVGAWDQNAAMRYATPATAAAEQVAGAWLLELLGLPAGADVGFTTGATGANFAALAAARAHVLDQAGWDVAADGMSGSPRVRVLVGAERHASIDMALKYLGLGRPAEVAVDAQGRIQPAALAQALDAGTGPAIVCLQAGNLHSGAFDPMGEAAGIAHRHGAWVHVDGAFGLWAAASPTHKSQLEGLADCDSWATDAHKTLNVPYDCGVAIVSRPQALRSVFGAQTSYLVTDRDGIGDPFEKVPEFSRRARGVPVWAALRSLGTSGIAALVDGLVAHAQAFGAALSRMDGVEVLNEVVFTQVCVGFGSDERTRSITARILADGTTWMSGSRWAGRDVLRISVSNWSTDASDVAACLDAIKRAVAAEDAS